MINLEKDKEYLLACSFGPDSMALFDMLQKEGFHFSAALVNYHLRKESNDEMERFIHYCKEQNIAYHVKDLIRGVGDVNVEAECRKIRYEFFAQLVAKFHYEAVLVAHNQDDLIETYLLQKKRQNLPIYFGIKEKTLINNTVVIRPLLAYPKAELAEYCHKNNVPFAIDSSNFETKYLRNKIRYEIVRKMSKEEREEIIKEINQKNAELQETLDRINHFDLHDLAIINKLSLTELAYALNTLIKRFNDKLSISLKQIKEARKVLLGKKSNVDIPLRSGIVLRKSYSEVEIVRPGKVDYQYFIDKPCMMENEFFYLDFTGDTKDRNVFSCDYPITIRNCHPSDKYTIKNYVVSVRRLFIDWKMPMSLRERWPVIINKEGKIIYIPRYQRDFEPTKETNFYVK